MHTDDFFCFPKVVTFTALQQPVCDGLNTHILCFFGTLIEVWTCSYRLLIIQLNLWCDACLFSNSSLIWEHILD